MPEISATSYDRGVFNTFLTNIAMQGANVFTGIITARLLQPQGRGELAAVVLWPTIIAGLGIFGTNMALAREAGIQKDKEADLALAGVVLALALAVVSMAAGYFIIPCLLPADKVHLTNLTRLYLGWIPFNFVVLNFLALDHGRMRWRSYNGTRFAVILIYLLILVALWLFNAPRVEYFVYALMISDLLVMVLRLAGGWSFLRQGRITLGFLGHIAKKCFPFFIAALGTTVALQVDKALAVLLLDSRAVGLYAVAFTFAAAHASLGSAFGITAFAAVANEPDHARQGLFLARVFRQATLLYVIAGAAVVIMCPLLVVPLFGKYFQPSIGPAAVLAVATTAAFLAQVLKEGLQGSGHVYPGVAAQVTGGGVVCLNAFLLVPPLGLTGLALAMVLGAVGQLGVLLFTACRIFNLRFSSLWGGRWMEIKELHGRLAALIPRPHGSFGLRNRS